MTAAAPSPVLVEGFRGEAVTVLANMTMASLGGGGDERRGEDHRCPPRPAGGDLPAAVVDGAGARAHRVHDAPVRAGRGGGAAGLGPPRRAGDRHRPGSLGPVGRGPGGIHRVGGPGVHRGGRGDLRDRDLAAGPLQRRGGTVDGVRGDHRDAADRRRRRLRSGRCQRSDAARLEGDDGRGGAACDGAAAAGQQAGRGRPRRAAHPVAGRVCPRRARRGDRRPRRRGAGRDLRSVRRLRRVWFGLRGGRRVRRSAVPVARLRRRLGGAITLGRTDSRPGAGRAAQPLLCRGVRARPVCLPPSGRSRRHRAHGTGRAAPRRVAGADRRAPRGLHQLGRLPGQRGRPGGQPHQRGSPPTP
jgi:hypothetical protein